jgi:hypothetical protein
LTKFRPYSSREFRRRFLEWVGRNLRTVSVLSAGTSGLLVALTLLLLVLMPASGFKWYALGTIHVGVIAVYLHLLRSAFLAHDREAIWHLRGAWGEDNTRTELQRAKRKRLVWGWVDSITLQAGDLDHLVVTRQGGLVALDSKWRNQHTADDALDMARAASRARVRAEGLAQTLLKSQRGAKHRGRANPLTVRPAVVLWGAAQHNVPDGAEIDGIEFIPGRRLLDWLSRLEGQPVTKDAAAELLERLTGYRATAWDQTHNATRRAEHKT